MVISSLPFQSTLDCGTKPVPVTVNCVAKLLTGALLILSPLVLIVGMVSVTVNVTEFDSEPLFDTVTWAGPAVVSKFIGMVALNCVALLKLVTRSDPFQSTLEVDRKPVPVTVRVVGPLLTTALTGLSPFATLIVGPATTLKVTAFDGVPVVEFITVICTEPTTVSKFAGMVAVN